HRARDVEAALGEGRGRRVITPAPVPARASGDVASEPPLVTASEPPLDIVILGLSITSSWGNGHATTYRALMRELGARGHRVLFLERDVPWYAAHRDLPHPPYGRTALYRSLEELELRHGRDVARADAVI